MVAGLDEIRLVGFILEHEHDAARVDDEETPDTIGNPVSAKQSGRNGLVGKYVGGPLVN